MGFKTISMVLGAPVADDGTVTGIAYPPGTNQATFTGANGNATGGKAIINNNDVYDQTDPGIGITYGASTITLTNLSGVTWPAGASVILQVANVTALDAIQAKSLSVTPAELNMLDDDVRVEIVTATNVINAQESGKTFFLDAVAGFVSTLPVPVSGMRFDFIVKTAPTSNGYLIKSNGDTNIIKLNTVEGLTNTGLTDDDADVVTFAANVALAGDRLSLVSDGTYWYGTGTLRADNALTSATT